MTSNQQPNPLDQENEAGKAGPSRLRCRWWIAGTILVALHLILTLLSRHFTDERDLLSKPVFTLVALLLCASASYLIIVPEIRRVTTDRRLLLWIIIVGTLMRVSLFFSAPMLEDDYYRYLWDGAVISKGINPYAYSPRQILGNSSHEQPIPPGLRELASEAGSVVARINHPQFRTLYPPVAQAAFALAYWIHPWSLFAWRTVLLGFDIATLLLLWLILRRMRLPLASIALYWWSPLVTKEIFNSAHMDVLVLPFVLAAVWFTLRDRPVAAAGLLGLAVGVKVWPVAFLPLLLRSVFANPRRLFVALGLFAVLGGVMFFPIQAAGLDQRSGFTAYGLSWENNDAFFMALLHGIQLLLSLAPMPTLHGQLLARFIVAAVFGLWTAGLALKKISCPEDLLERCLLVLAAVFLLSPTGFPWYCVWMIPFLTIRPRWSLLLLTALLPLYYLRYYFEPRHQLEIFIFGIVWLEYLPVWYLFTRELISGHRRRVDWRKAAFS